MSYYRGTQQWDAARPPVGGEDLRRLTAVLYLDAGYQVTTASHSRCQFTGLW